MRAGFHTVPRVVLISFPPHRNRWARLESRDKLSDVIESASSITCSCAVRITGTPDATTDRTSPTNVGFRAWVAGPTRGEQRTSIAAKFAQADLLVCADRYNVLPGVAHLLKRSNCVLLKTGQGLGKREPGVACWNELTARSLTRGPCHVWMGAPG